MYYENNNELLNVIKSLPRGCEGSNEIVFLKKNENPSKVFFVYFEPRRIVMESILRQLVVTMRGVLCAQNLLTRYGTNKNWVVQPICYTTMRRKKDHSKSISLQ